MFEVKKDEKGIINDREMIIEVDNRTHTSHPTHKIFNYDGKIYMFKPIPKEDF